MRTGLVSRKKVARRLVIQRMMRAFVVVEREPLPDPRSRFCCGFVSTQVDFFVFQTTPQTFAKDVVKATSFAIHADPNALAFERRNKGFAGKLDALIRVEYFRVAVRVQRL